MYFLLYEKEGMLKKHPLNKPETKIGRGRGNDISLTDRDVSKNHCRVLLDKDETVIQDLGSRNGTAVDGRLIKETRLGLNGSFSVGATRFFFKKGDPREFALSRSLSEIFAALARDMRPDGSRELDTETQADRQELTLQAAAEAALTQEDPSVFFKSLRRLLGDLLAGHRLYFASASSAKALTPGNEEGDAAEIDWTRLAPNQNVSINGREHRVIQFPSRNGDAADGLWLLAAAGALSRPPGPDFFARLLEIIEVHGRLKPPLPEPRRIPPALYEDSRVTLIGAAPSFRNLVEQARRIASKTSFVLILGESGTGKELLAKMIHAQSGRRSFVALNCAAIPALLLESELFGHEPGAFTDAKSRKIGMMEASSGGTLVLDEIADMPLEIQVKLLRAIQEQAVTRLGGTVSLPVDLRILALTNRNLYARLKDGRFREDLFYRLRVHELRIPPLRERPEDISPLIRHFAGLYAEKNGVRPAGFSQAAEDILLRYPWPGNVRELENEIRRILEMTDDGEVIGSHHLLPGIVAAVRPESPPDRIAGGSMKDKLRKTEKAEIEARLAENGGNKSKTAREIGITYRGFLKKLKRLGI